MCHVHLHHNVGWWPAQSLHVNRNKQTYTTRMIFLIIILFPFPVSPHLQIYIHAFLKLQTHTAMMIDDTHPTN